MELFVPKQHLTAAAAFLQEAIPFFAGLNTVVSGSLSGELARAGLLDEFKALRGRYVHHYLIFFRRVLGEETYFAMNQGGERGIRSVFSHSSRRGKRRTYYAVCGFLATGVCTALLGATALGEVQPADGRGDRVALSGAGALSPDLPGA